MSFTFTHVALVAGKIIELVQRGIRDADALHNELVIDCLALYPGSTGTVPVKIGPKGT